MINIGVATWNSQQFNDGHFDVLFKTPDLVLKDLQNKEEYKTIIQCPSIKASLKNVYAVRAPFDMRIKLNTEDKSVEIYTQKTFVINEELSLPVYYSNNSTVINIDYPSFCFLANEDVEVETLPACYHQNEFTANFQSPIGKFNIHKWVRPMSFGFIPMKKELDVLIKKDSVLIYVRFTSKKDDTVKLKRTQDSDTARIARACLASKNFIKSHSLTNLYDMFVHAYSFKKWKI